MISTKYMRLVAQSPALHALKRSITQQAKSALFKPAIVSGFNASPRYLSTIAADSDFAAPVREVGKIEKTLKALDMAVVRQIKAELMEVDANSDGRQVTRTHAVR